MSESRPCPYCVAHDRDPADCWWCQGAGTLTEEQEQARSAVHPKFGFDRPPVQIPADAWEKLERMRNGEILEFDDGRPQERDEQEQIIRLELTERELREVLSCIRVHGRGGQIPPKDRRDYLERILDDQWEDQHPFSCL